MMNGKETEKVALGCLIYDYKKHNLTVNDFVDERNKTIFTAIEKLSLKGNIDSIILDNEVNDLEYINHLTSLVVSSTNFEHYQEILITRRIKRNLSIMGLQLEVMYNSNATYNEMIGYINEVLVTNELPSKKNVDSKSLVDRADKDIRSTFKRVAKYGIKTFDNELPITDGQFIVIGARPSHGKTSLLLQMAINNLNKNVAVFSQEMPERTAMQRVLSNMSTVQLSKIVAKTYNETDYQCLKEIYLELSKSKFKLNDEIIPVEKICQDIKQYKYDIVFIDYLQYLRMAKKYKSRHEEVADISRLLKTTAKQTGTVIVVAAMLNRDSTGKPKMSDLRWSAEIEADADVIFLLHNVTFEEMERKNSEFDDVKIYVAKARQGEAGYRKSVKFYRQTQAWYDN